MNQTWNGSLLQTVDNIYACHNTSVLFHLSAVFGMWPLHKMQLHSTFQIRITHIAKSNKAYACHVQYGATTLKIHTN
jgi:hypothetical protein